jgi:hypothetical protein
MRISPPGETVTGPSSGSQHLTPAVRVGSAGPSLRSGYGMAADRGAASRSSDLYPKITERELEIVTACDLAQEGYGVVTAPAHSTGVSMT